MKLDYELIQSWLRRLDADTVVEYCRGSWSFAKSSGPGGQHVNKTNSKAVLSLPQIHLVDDIPLAVRSRLPRPWHIKSDAYRSQEDNKQECIVKLMKKLALVAEQAAPAPPSLEQQRKVEML
jgi:peptidyl-tRNA hydrolase ICT1